jgi:hypothetical protein
MSVSTLLGSGILARYFDRSRAFGRDDRQSTSRNARDDEKIVTGEDSFKFMMLPK